MQKSIQGVIGQLCDLLQQLSCNEYRQPCSLLNGATIGQHVRHIVELYQCLLAGYEQGTVNYDNRKRDIIIENNRTYAYELLINTASNLNLQNRRLMLHSNCDEENGEMLTVETNFYREVVYNLEHTIHHLAFIRIGVQEVTSITLDACFGVALSTIQYRKACAQ